MNWAFFLYFKTECNEKNLNYRDTALKVVVNLTLVYSGEEEILALGNLAKRIIVAAIGGPAIIACVWFGGWFYWGLMTLMAMLAGFEFIKFTEEKGMRPSRMPILLFFPLLFLIIYFNQRHFLLEVIAGYTILLLLLELAKKENNAISNVSAALLTTIYIGILYGFLLDLRELPDSVGLTDKFGANLVFIVLLATWICDTSAYAAGKKFGRYKLAPLVSPNKTVEGAIGGVLGAVGTTLLCHSFLDTALQLLDIVVIGLIIGVFGQLSDLVESLFKRDAGIKDSSSILPGHGGVLDRFDSELLSVPVIYVYLKYLVWG